MADACCTDRNRAGVASNKRNLAIRFTKILPSGIPCKTIESQVVGNVSGNYFLNCGWNQRVRDWRLGQAFFARREWNCEPRRETTTTRVKLAAELKLFEPLYSFTLVGNDLRLPHQRDGHAAHGDHAQDQNNPDAGLVSGKVEQALKPSHGKGSPSTRFDSIGNSLENPSRQRRGRAIANEFQGNRGAKISLAPGISYPTENRRFV